MWDPWNWTVYCSHLCHCWVTSAPLWELRAHAESTPKPQLYDVESTPMKLFTQAGGSMDLTPGHRLRSPYISWWTPCVLVRFRAFSVQKVGAREAARDSEFSTLSGLSVARAWGRRQSTQRLRDGEEEAGWGEVLGEGSFLDFRSALLLVIMTHKQSTRHVCKAQHLPATTTTAKCPSQWPGILLFHS